MAPQRGNNSQVNGNPMKKLKIGGRNVKSSENKIVKSLDYEIVSLSIFYLKFWV